MPCTKQLKKVRNRLHAANPHCEKCGILTILPEDLPYTIDALGTKQIDNIPNMATIQHKYHKLHPLRRVVNRRERRLFLWCYKCNNQYWLEYEQPAQLKYLKAINKHENKL